MSLANATCRPRRRGSTALLTMLAMFAAPAVAAGVPGSAQAATAGSTRAAASSATLSKNVTANLFEYNWPSIASECTNVLGPDGYAAVQVSPPEDSLKAVGDPWWQVYQPVDYNLTSMMGTPAQFQAMVSACHAAGVKVYVDAVLNHMAAQPTSGSGTSFGGESYSPSTLSYPAYDAADFHSYPADCPEPGNSIVNWLSYTEVTECQLDGLPDLATETTYVRDTEAAYLNSLIADGVDGFRLDSAANIGETDIAAIEAMLNRDTTTGAPVFITQEVYPGSGGQDPRLNPASFEPEGSVTSFDYSYALTDDFEGGDIAALNSFSAELPSADASSFVTNQDTERASPPTLNYTNGAQYILADEFLLAYGYGTPQIYSSFDFSSYNQSPPVNGSGDVTNTVCGQGTWECTEQNPAIIGLIGWHNLAYTDNDPVENWTTDGSNMVAFSRGTDAWIALNNGSSAVTGTFPTGLANGAYCDIVNDTLTGGTCSGTPVTVSGGEATVTVPAEDGVAFDVNDLVSSTGPLSATLAASSTQPGYPASNANDANTATYWESADGAAYPQTLTANLGSVRSLGSVTLDLPPTWGARTETLSVLGSDNDSSWTTLVGSANYTFNPAPGNTLSLTLPAGTAEQYLRLNFTANTGWSAAQISEFQIFPGGSGSSGATLAASPTSLAFGSQTVGATSGAQTVTVSNTGIAAAAVSSVSVTGAFGQTNTCGSSIAAGGSCTVGVTFTPTATGTTTGTLTVASNATNPSLTVALSGTGNTTSGGTPVNLALNAPVTASSYTQSYVPANAVDGNTSTYWESVNGSWPATFTVDLGTQDSLSSLVLDLPPATAWSTRTQTLSVLGSTNGSTYTTLVASATYTFNPATGNTVTIALPSDTTDQYVQLSFTANSVQNGAQLSELDLYGP